MTKALSLHLGLNLVDPSHYAGWSGPLQACEADANDMALIASTRGFESTVLLTQDATRETVLENISAAARALGDGDIFLLTNSSHGGQLPDTNGDEDDKLDETWCLYDGELIDDELYLALAGFGAGVRVVVISDSCHSGSVVKSPVLRAVFGDMLSVQSALSNAFKDMGGALPRTLGTSPDLFSRPRPKAMPAEIVTRTYLENKAFYDAISTRDDLKDARSKVAASVILLAGCQDNQLSMDGPFNGAFTGELKRVWNGGAYSGGYSDFLFAIRRSLPPTQSPNYFTIGAANPAFEAQRPFEV